MSGSESTLWGTTKLNLSPFGFLHRIENKCHEGTPDILYLLHRKPREKPVTGFLELKHTDWRARDTTPFTIESLKREQVVFLNEWRRAGGVAWALVQAGPDYMLLTPEVLLNVYSGKYANREIIQAATLFWQSPSPWPMARLLDELIK